MRWLLGALTLVLAFSGCSLGDDDERASAVASSQFVADLQRAGEAGQGQVGLSSAGSKTTVMVELADRNAEGLEAEIRRGNCDVVDNATAYVLESVTAGVSKTVVDVPLTHLRRSGYLVRVQVSTLDSLCADLAQSQPPSAAPTFD